MSFKCSSKTKKMLEENSVILQAQNISRFLNYTSGIFLYPLRFSANFGNIETHNGKFNGSSDQSHFIFEIDVGKRRIRP